MLSNYVILNPGSGDAAKCRGCKNMSSHEKYMQDLRQWLHDTSDTPLEEMSAFFTKRLDDYEEHMSVWEKSYQLFSDRKSVV